MTRLGVYSMPVGPGSAREYESELCAEVAYYFPLLIIEGPANATFSVVQATAEEFEGIFLADGQDMVLIEDFIERVEQERAWRIVQLIGERPVLKREANGIHGTLYYNYVDRRRYLPATKWKVGWDDLSINFAQRQLFVAQR